jgi:hypothetical protein
LERNIVGLNLCEMEDAIGYIPGQLRDGCRILLLVEQPSVGQFAFAGSSLTPAAEHLVPQPKREHIPIAGAWWGERLVKVKPNSPYFEGKWPKAKRPVEQWLLTQYVTAREIARLSGNDVYWPR